MTRAPGFYWLRAEDGTWTVGRRYPVGWLMLGETEWLDEDDGAVCVGGARYTIGPRIEAPGEEGTR